jgi:hypothetical protein
MGSWLGSVDNVNGMSPHQLDDLSGAGDDAARYPLIATDQFSSVTTHVASVVSVAWHPHSTDSPTVPP